MMKLTCSSFAILVGLFVASTSHAQMPRYADFNCDGRPDVAIAVPGHDVVLPGGSVVPGAGSVVVLQRNSNGTYSTMHVLNANSGTLLSGSAPAQEDAGFGVSLSWGNFNGDSCWDLVVGEPGRTISGQPNAGAVRVFFGSSTGLLTYRSQLLHRNMPSVEGNAAENDLFGISTTAGDFNGDGRDDLVIGLGVGGAPVGTGSAHLFFGEGTANGLNTITDVLIPHTRLSSSLSANAGFGLRLASGDFDCDGIEDLAVAAPYHGNVAGAFGVIYGPVATSTRTEVHLGTVPGAMLGIALAAGNFNNDYKAGRPCVDLAVGAPGHVVNGVAGGAVFVARSNQSRLLVSPTQTTVLSQAGSIIGALEAGDAFGWSVATGRVNNDDFDDLLVGVPNENTARGGFHVIKGSSTGVTTSGNAHFGQGSLGGGFAEEVGDMFGYAVSASGTGIVFAAAPYEVVESFSSNAIGAAWMSKFQHTSSFVLDGSARLHDGRTAGSPVDGQGFGLFMTSSRPGFWR